MVKLLIYSHAFVPQVGGIETFTMYLALGLADLGYKGQPDFIVTVVTQTPATERKEHLDTPFNVVRRPSPSTLWRLIGENDKVFLVGPAILPLLFGLMRRKPLVVSHHGYQSICPNGMLFHFPSQRSCPGHFAARHYIQCIRCNARQQGLAGSTWMMLLTFVRRALSRLADSNVGTSEHVSRRIALPKSRSVRNSVPDRRVQAQLVDIDDDHLVRFAYVGRLVTEKGLPVLIEASRILKSRGRKFHNLIIGDGPERDSLQRQVACSKLEGEMSFLGFRRATELGEVMKGVSALVMPSICEDVAPFAVLEQMMQGRVIIGSRIGGLAEEIGETGLTFEPGNAIELADQMERVIQNPGLKRSLGAQARERALKNYSLQRMIEEYADLLSAR